MMVKYVLLILYYQYTLSDLTDWMQNSLDETNGAVTVFSVEKCLNPRSTPPKGQLGFSEFEIDVDKLYGDFHLPTGTFTVKTSGLYLLHFSGYYSNKLADAAHDDRSYGACVELRIDSLPVPIARSIDSDAVRHSNLIEYPPVVVTALLPLKAGDNINAFAHSTRLHEDSPTYTTRFAATLFTDDYFRDFFLPHQ